tara:strand:+ start:671 stop:1390 length:720 start_codon:yes stop_codon:yes gene_type:complete
MIKKSSNLSLIIPCFNEQDNLPLLFKRLLKIQTKFNEIILVDNGSTDNTSLIIENFIKNNDSCIKIIKIKKNIGYGHGIMSGIRKSSGQIVAWTHADLQTDPQDVVDAYKYFASKKGDPNFILKGKRKKRKFFDNLFTSLMSIVSSIAFNIRLSDINAQPKMFSRNFIKYIDKAPNDFSLDLFILVKAIKMNYTILEYPVMFKNRNYGISKGGGSFVGKIKLTLRTLSYINKLRTTLKR